MMKEYWLKDKWDYNSVHQYEYTYLYSLNRKSNRAVECATSD